MNLQTFSKICAFPLLLTFLILTLSSCGEEGVSSDGKYTLLMNFPEGEKYYYTTEMNQEISSAGMEMHQEMVFGLIYEMMEPEEGLKKVQATYDQLKFKAETPMGAMEYDTKDPSASSPLAVLQDIVGKAIVVYFDQDGKIQRVSGMEDILGDNPAQTLSDSSLAQMVTNSFDFYPGKPVAIGESWSKSNSLDMNGMQLEVKSKYTLASVSEGVANIKLKSTISMPNAKMSQDDEMEISMNGTQQGEMKLELDTGHLIGGDIDQEIKGELQAGGQKMPMEIKSTILISSKKMD